jgi:hypothetical protein
MAGKSSRNASQSKSSVPTHERTPPNATPRPARSAAEPVHEKRATAPTDTTAPAVEPSTSTAAHDRETIGSRAYFLWERAGRPWGDGVEFWLQAERELTHPK